ncbi:MAG: carbohydrate porin [Thermoflavifilum sp.]|nr:carbohydrate porin [Thermoflavifilum sp.]
MIMGLSGISGTTAMAQQMKALPDSNWSIHYQMTVISQYHPSFHAAYSGKNSLSTSADWATSLTSTLYLGRRLWRNAILFASPEISGGQGFNDVRGIAGFTNGDIYRVSDPKPQVYLARLYWVQYIPLSDRLMQQSDEILQVGGYVPESRLELIIGKLPMTDLFDDNVASHDPRTQFMNWSIMDNGAWDFPADVRGYDAIASIAYISHLWKIRFAEALEPVYANAAVLSWDLHKSHSETLEIGYSERSFHLRVHAYHNFTPAPRYADVINQKRLGIDTSLDVIHPAADSHAKNGIGINADYQFNTRSIAFLRVGWNDGHTATWAFTEIDRTLSGGLVRDLQLSFSQQPIRLGCAFVINGLSADHRDFIANGGYGFVIGDGRLRYGTENIIEAYLAIPIRQFLQVSGDYQWVQHPAYNCDRGPVSVWSIRVHVDL